MRRERPPNVYLLCCVLALLAVGLTMVYSASYAKASVYSETGGDGAFYAKKQILAALVGLLILCTVQALSYRCLRRLSYPTFILAVGALLLVLVIGTVSQGARRWFSLGFVSFQPSEFAKLAIVLAGARFLSQERTYFRTAQGFAVCSGVLLMVAGLIAKEDLGTAVALVLGTLVLFYIAGARRQHLVTLGVVMVLAGALCVAIEPYRFDRIYAWLYPQRTSLQGSYQANHSLIALGSGGPLGRGLCESREKYFYLPAASTDCIFAVLGEELGLAGTLTVLTLFLCIAYQGAVAARAASDRFSSLLAAGATAMICCQALLNMAVVTGLLPTTGVPLPLISYGGTSLVITLANAGLILNVSRGASLPAISRRRAVSRAPGYQRRGSGLHRRRPVMGAGH